MKKYLLIAVGLFLCFPVHGLERSGVVSDVTTWYDAAGNSEVPIMDLPQQLMGTSNSPH